MSAPTTETIVTIPLEEVVTIEVSGYFYRQVLASYFSFSNSVESTKFEELCHALTDNKVDLLSEDDKTLALTLHTYLSLIKTVENAFHEKGLPSKEKIDVPNVD